MNNTNQLNIKSHPRRDNNIQINQMFVAYCKFKIKCMSKCLTLELNASENVCQNEMNCCKKGSRVGYVNQVLCLVIYMQVTEEFSLQPVDVG